MLIGGLEVGPYNLVIQEVDSDSCLRRFGTVSGCDRQTERQAPLR